MSTKFKGASGHVSSMKSLDVRRLWEKLHTSDFRDNCFPFYREATFEKPEISPRVRGGSREPKSRMSFMRRIALGSTEGRVTLALATVLGLGIGITRLLAVSSQSSSNKRVEEYVESLRKDWEQYQTVVKKQ